MIYINYVNIFINYDRIIKTMHDIMVFGAIETIKLLFLGAKIYFVTKVVRLCSKSRTHK